MIALFSEVARRLWQTDKLEWEYLPAKADLVLVPPERHLPVPADFSFSTFLPRSSPLYEELDLPTAENEADPWPLCFWQVTLKVFSSYHFGQLPFPCVALDFLGNIGSTQKHVKLAGVWFCHLLVTGWAGGAPSHLKELMEINEKWWLFWCSWYNLTQFAGLLVQSVDRIAGFFRSMSLDWNFAPRFCWLTIAL